MYICRANTHTHKVKIKKMTLMSSLMQTLLSQSSWFLHLEVKKAGPELKSPLDFDTLEFLSSLIKATVCIALSASLFLFM